MSSAIYIGILDKDDIPKIDNINNDSIKVLWLNSEENMFDFKYQNIYTKNLGIKRLGIIGEPKKLEEDLKNKAPIKNFSKSLMADLKSYRTNMLSKERIMNLPVYSQNTDESVEYPILFRYLDSLANLKIHNFILIYIPTEGLSSDVWDGYFEKLPSYSETDITGIKYFLENYVYSDSYYFSKEVGNFRLVMDTTHVFKVFKDLGL